MKRFPARLVAIAGVCAWLCACDRLQTHQTSDMTTAMALAYMARTDPAGAQRARGLADPQSDPEVQYYAAWPKLRYKIDPETRTTGCGVVSTPADLTQYDSLIAGMSAAEAEATMVKSATAGYAPAQTAVAKLIDHGVLLDGLDDPSALTWMNRAATQGDRDAQYQLGQYYQIGRYAGMDIAQAMTWYGKAADQGDTPAMTALADLYLAGKQVPRDTDQAIALYRKAADAGDGTAQVTLAGLYYDGKVMQKDYGQAAHYYQTAAQACDHTAQFRLGYLYQTGQGVDHDDAKAADLYRQSAKWQSSAAYNLGTMYEKGQGVPQDDTKAAAAFAMGADRNDPSSQAALARHFESGAGVTKDTRKAEQLYCLAAGGLGGLTRFNCLRLRAVLGIEGVFQGAPSPQDTASASDDE